MGPDALLGEGVVYFGVMGLRRQRRAFSKSKGLPCIWQAKDLHNDG